MSAHAVDRRAPVVPSSPIGGFARVLPLWLRRARTRRQLATLSDHALRDLGLDRSTAFREAIKPFWQA